MKNIYIIDVRSYEEYEEGHKENAINLSVEDIYNNTDEAKSILNNIQKEDTIYLYCASGARAEFAKRILIDLGFKNVTNLGGF